MKLKFAHHVLLEMYFCKALFFAVVKNYSFWPKTMDYSQGF